MGYLWEGSASIAIPPPSASDIMGQHNEMLLLQHASYKTVVDKNSFAVCYPTLQVIIRGKKKRQLEIKWKVLQVLQNA